MEGRYFDGRSTAARQVTLSRDGAGLRITWPDGEVCWTLRGVRAEETAGGVRLSHADGHDRLMVTPGVWADLGGGAPGASRSEWRLLAGLTAVAGAAAALVLVGVPLASGPLARATPPALERQIGDTFYEQLAQAFSACSSGDAQVALQSVAGRLQAHSPTPFRFTVAVVHAPFPNAFALPGGRIVVTDDLIRLAGSPDELAAVLAHEAAHVERRHVMQATWRSLGLGLVLDLVVGGGSGAGQQAVLLAGNVANLRYSRSAEAEADARGRALLEAAGLSSQGMAPMFERLARYEGATPIGLPEAFSSHPDSLLRAAEARRLARPGEAALTPQAWTRTRAACTR